MIRAGSRRVTITVATRSHGSALTETHVAYMQDADGKGAGGYETLIGVWYIGANGGRDDDSDRYEGMFFLPIVVKQSTLK